MSPELPQPLDVIAVGAHPDDVEIGVGGILAAHRAAGARIIIATLSRGSCGGAGAVRVEEARASATLLGAELRMGDFPDTRLDSQIIPWLERLIGEVKPSVVYTHSSADRHQDHRAVHEATLVAARSVGSVYCYEAPSTTVDFKPARFVDVSGYMPQKHAALEAFKSQNGRAYLATGMIESTARYWGRFAGHGMVEPLEVVREAVSVAA